MGQESQKWTPTRHQRFWQFRRFSIQKPSASATCLLTVSQSPLAGWRNNRMEGYQALAIQKPSPIWHELQHHPDRRAERAGQMGDGPVQRDD